MEERLHERLVVKVGDITLEAVDAIVNAANSSLLGGGGVDGAIHRAGGPRILEACRKLRETTCPDGLPTGEAAITTAGRLPAKHVIHVVGPIHGDHGGAEPRLLASCYSKALALAAGHALESIAFPSVSTGVFGYPREAAAPVVRRAIDEALKDHRVIRDVRLVFFSEEDARVFLASCRG